MTCISNPYCLRISSIQPSLWSVKAAVDNTGLTKKFIWVFLCNTLQNKPFGQPNMLDWMGIFQQNYITQTGGHSLHTPGLQACYFKNVAWINLMVGVLLLCAVLMLSRVQLSVTPWTVACKAPLSLGILQARILEWVAMPSSRGSS